MKFFFSSLRSGDEISNQFDQLVRPHISALYKTAYKLTGSAHDAEDIIQDVLIKLYLKTSEILAVKELRPWLFRCVYNQFIDHCRKKQRYPSTDQNHNELAEGSILDRLISPEPGPQQLTVISEQCDEVMAALSSLGNEQRAMVVLHFIEGLTLDELAGIFNLPLGTVKSRLHRIKAQLKKYLVVEPFLLFGRDRNGDNAKREQG